MSNPTRLVRDEAYEEMGSAYQCLLVSILDAALREHGVNDSDSRQEICGSFLFQLGILHDQGWFQTTDASNPVYPLLCFTKTFLNTDTPVTEIGDVFAPSEHFAFEEYAMGNAALLYENDPNAHVINGCVGEEPAS